MKIKALIFDFDGLILDTETPEFQVWQTIYNQYGHQLMAEKWGQIVGGWGASKFDAAEHLAEIAGDVINLDELRARYRSESDALILIQPILPGVVDYLDQARQLGIQLAIASSSPHSWVDPHLTRLGLADRFDIIICADDVPPGRTKPNPDLFLKALEELGVGTGQAIVLEDSPNGVRAAHAAGIFVVLVPNPLTAKLKTDDSNVTLDSLADMPLQELLLITSKLGVIL
ncbi:MAG: HAD-IA family hydrolase [Anaerolineae bacterium]|nr:HAD-IA family hydrolase [Anaerolineae bacterium]